MPTLTLAALRDRLALNLGPELRLEIEQAVAANREQRGGHVDWAHLCEEADLLALAFREYQLALRDQPNDPEAAYPLARLYHEQGDTARAADLLERLLATQPANEKWLKALLAVFASDQAWPSAHAVLDRAIQHGFPADRARALAPAKPPREEAVPEPGELDPTPADCARLQTLFGGREDVHARQWADQAGDTGYSPVQEPLTPAVLRNHLLGSYTVGVYPLRLDNTCTFFALDLDVDKAALEKARRQPEHARELRETLRAEATRLLAVLRELGLQPVFEDSGYKGRHYWIFLAEPEPAEVLYRLGRSFLAWQASSIPHGLHLEFFPKQPSRSGKGLGNLIKLPLGIHRRTGRRANLLDDAGQPLPRPLEYLRTVVKLARVDLHLLVDRLKGLAGAVPPAATNPASPAESHAAGVAKSSSLPPPPLPAPVWTEADFDADPRMRHVLAHCPVLSELKRTALEHRRLSHEEQLVLIHSLGHLEGGPLAVNYLLGRCLDVGPERFLKDRLKGNPVSCPSIRKKIPHITRRVACNCPFDFAPDRYPTPVLHLLTVPAPTAPEPPRQDDAETLARRYAAAIERRSALDRECGELTRELVQVLRALPDRAVQCTGGRFRLVDEQGVDEIRWEADAPPSAPSP